MVKVQLRHSEVYFESFLAGSKASRKDVLQDNGPQVFSSDAVSE
jgi:alpha-galactosidase